MTSLGRDWSLSFMLKITDVCNYIIHLGCIILIKVLLQIKLELWNQRGRSEGSTQTIMTLKLLVSWDKIYNFMINDWCVKGSLMSQEGHFCGLETSQGSPRHVDRHNQQKRFHTNSHRHTLVLQIVLLCLNDKPASSFLSSQWIHCDNFSHSATGNWPPGI